MTRDTSAETVPLTRLLADPSLLSVFAISFIGVVGSNAVPAALPAIATALDVGNGRLGLVLTVFYLPLIAITPMVGVLADIYGRRRIVIPSLLLFGVSGVATVAVESFQVLLALRVLQAVAFAGTLPLTAALVGDLYDGAAGSTAQGLRSSVNGVANAIAPVLAGVLATTNWRYAFLLFTVAFPVAGMVYLLYSDPMSVEGGDGTLGELRAELRAYWSVMRSETVDRNLGVLLFGGFTLFFLKQGIKAYLPVFVVQELGADVSTAGLVLGVYGAVRIFVAPLSGAISERTGRKYGLLVSLLILGSAMAAIPWAGSVGTLTTVVGLFAVGEALFNPILSSSVADLVADGNRGGVMGGLSTLKATANTIAPALVGFVVVAGGFQAAFLLPALLGLGYAVAVFALVERAAVEHGGTPAHVD